jgi:multisubunit Na+/H+ antiporter MnhG subunit
VSWREVVATVLLVAGGVIEVLSVLGLVTMRSVHDRLHYVSLSGVGALLIGVAILFREGFSLIGDKALLIGVVLVSTGPVLVQTTMRSLLIRARGDWREGIERFVEDPESGE